MNDVLNTVNHITLEAMLFKLVDTYGNNYGNYEVYRRGDVTVLINQNGEYKVALNSKAVDVDGLEGLKILIKSPR